ncbi:trypsin-like cysteine/serine peptidase domain-containing protein [Aspergillus transmontanensis]|uniref:Serine protease n=1 Tax=Aspergillus transmontanensis TaxID=1034304 RepID=A0A5N6W2Q2_9EURO|nr:trypsin-like cysteine/serine peptidase domain-containing protein [Aspergillus transmontanensis]
MAEDGALHPLMWDRSWSQLPAKQETGGLKGSKAQSRENWVVKLRFSQAGTDEEKVGTGFYLNLPGASYHIILTAAHNLVDKQRILSKNLSIQSYGDEEPRPIQPPTKLLYYPDYIGQTDPESDYGLITFPRGSDDSDNGFGFALSLGYENLRGEELYVSGYAPHETGQATNQPSVYTNTGKCSRASTNQLDYKIPTEKGWSGSPVYMAYNGHETVVAIHNNGEPRAGTGKGARVNARMLEWIFDSTGALHRNKALRAVASLAKKPTVEPADPVYLHFLPCRKYACTHWGTEELNTTFNVFPAYAPTPLVNASTLYVFQHVQPHDWPVERQTEKWVLWDVITGEVKLTDTPQRFCFPRLKEPRKARRIFTVVFEMDNADDLRCLVMNGDDIRELDRRMGDFDGSRIEFRKYKRGKNYKYYTFDWGELHG